MYHMPLSSQNFNSKSDFFVKAGRFEKNIGNVGTRIKNFCNFLEENLLIFNNKYSINNLILNLYSYLLKYIYHYNFLYLKTFFSMFT